MTHELKTWKTYYSAIITGKKKFEVRKDDRGFRVGGKLHLREWDEKKEQYTGNGITIDITYKLDGGQFGIEQGYCVLGLGSSIKYD